MIEQVCCSEGVVFLVVVVVVVVAIVGKSVACVSVSVFGAGGRR